jgi:flagellar basal-body rod protein FlgB
VSYLDNLFGPQADQLSRAMSKTAERQAMLVKNLANVNTPGYKRQDMDFNIKLEASMDNFDQVVANRTHGAMQAENSSLRSDGNNVDMEFEVMSIATTEARFNSLAELTSRYFSGLKNIIREGH